MGFLLIALIAVAAVIALASWIGKLSSPPQRQATQTTRPPQSEDIWRHPSPTMPVAPRARPSLSDAAKTSNGPVGALTFDLVYQDADGDVSARRVDIDDVSRNFDTYYIEAHCHLRDAPRSFRADRVLELASASTGEVLSPPLEGLRQYIKEHNDPGPDYASVMSKAKKGLAVLIWIARADNDLSEKETNILIEYIIERDAMGARNTGDRVWKEAAARSWIDAQRPTMEEAVGSRATLGYAGKEDALCATFVKKIVACQPIDVANKVSGRVKKLGYKNL